MYCRCEAKSAAGWMKSLGSVMTERRAPRGFRFLLRDIRMLAGEARDIASDRAGFLGSHPEAGATRALRKPQ
jgi:hypothetical protein